MAMRGSFTDDKALDATGAGLERIDLVRSAIGRTNLVQPAPPATATAAHMPPQARMREHLDGNVYLFIYRVRHGYDAYAWVDNIRYCTVFAYGKTFDDAERIAINCVHQHGWRILKTDTATAFAVDRFTDGGTDSAHVANLWDFGVSFKLNH
jgi:hypothetical protein